MKSCPTIYVSNWPFWTSAQTSVVRVCQTGIFKSMKPFFLKDFGCRQKCNSTFYLSCEQNTKSLMNTMNTCKSAKRRRQNQTNIVVCKYKMSAIKILNIEAYYLKPPLSKRFHFLFHSSKIAKFCKSFQKRVLKKHAKDILWKLLYTHAWRRLDQVIETINILYLDRCCY